jgi:hypothetical protein
VRPFRQAVGRFRDWDAITLAVSVARKGYSDSPAAATTSSSTTTTEAKMLLIIIIIG